MVINVVKYLKKNYYTTMSWSLRWRSPNYFPWQEQKYNLSVQTNVLLPLCNDTEWKGKKEKTGEGEKDESELSRSLFLIIIHPLTNSTAWTVGQCHSRMQLGRLVKCTALNSNPPVVSQLLTSYEWPRTSPIVTGFSQEGRSQIGICNWVQNSVSRKY